MGSEGAGDEEEAVGGAGCERLPLLAMACTIEVAIME